MSIHIRYSEEGAEKPSCCEIQIAGRPLFEDRRLIKRGGSPLSPEGVNLGPGQALHIFLGTVKGLCESASAQIDIGPPSIQIHFVLHEDQRIQIVIKPSPNVKHFTRLKEEWTDLPRYTIDLFSQTDQLLKRSWQGWQGSPSHEALKKSRKEAEEAYWTYLQKRRGDFDVADDRKPTQGAGPRDIEHC